MVEGAQRPGSRTDWHEIEYEGQVFDVRVEYAVTDVASILVGFEIRSRDNAPITRDVRALPIPPEPNRRVDVLPVRRDVHGDLVQDDQGYPVPVGADVRPGPGAPRQYGDVHYRAVARAVLDAEHDGLPVWETIRKAFKLGSDRTTARHIQEARNRDFLPPARRKGK